MTLNKNANKVMLKILHARLQQYVNHELPDVQAAFRKGRGTRDQIANIHWIMEKARVLLPHGIINLFIQRALLHRYIHKTCYSDLYFFIPSKNQ